MADRLLTMRDGRRLGLTAFGDPAVERVVVVCHPAPGASGFDPDPEVTSSWGVHVVSVDRPGYGSSTAYDDERRPTVGGWSDDVAEYLELVVQQARESGHTPLHRVGVVGWSAGGRVALALAARHPGLVDRVAVVATPAPDSAVRWIPEELERVNRELLAMPVADAKQRLRGMLRAQIPDGTPGVELLAQGEADLALLDRPGLRGRLQRMLQHAYDQGTVGLADDLLSYVGDDWGFDLADVHAPTLLVYGAKDPLVPSAHGRWYRRHLTNASPHLEVVPRAGHLVIAPAWQRILQHVDPQHGSRSDV
ncbi:alpha/beta fold hydrolase [uncultured Amnibacterium sp.]|uniref:alpha/beta fold hydrolase n=1 Tax=uncultured Amnibacterium sp. TaxID=1631851 RepID=UPI0035CA1A81